MKTLYLVYTDRADVDYGMELYCMGIFDSMEAAVNCTTKLRYYKIVEIKLNSNTTDVLLDKYYENHLI